MKLKTHSLSSVIHLEPSQRRSSCWAGSRGEKDTEIQKRKTKIHSEWEKVDWKLLIQRIYIYLYIYKTFFLTITSRRCALGAATFFLHPLRSLRLWPCTQILSPAFSVSLGNLERHRDSTLNVKLSKCCLFLYKISTITSYKQYCSLTENKCMKKQKESLSFTVFLNQILHLAMEFIVNHHIAAVLKSPSGRSPWWFSVFFTSVHQTSPPDSSLHIHNMYDKVNELKEMVRFAKEHLVGLSNLNNHFNLDFHDSEPKLKSWLGLGTCSL